MAVLLSRLANAILSATTSDRGRSSLPPSLARSLALIATSDGDSWEQQETPEASLAREAVALYRVATRQSGGHVPVGWHFSKDGSRAVQVLPRATQDNHAAALKEFGSYLKRITMNHPGLVPVYSTGYDKGFPYMSARLNPDALRLSQSPVPCETDRAFRIILQVADALDYAHYRNLFHGIMSLDDIFMTDAGSIHTQVLGVGMEQLRRQLDALSRPVQSPLLSPEVARGQAPDTRSDVYAVGALLYLLLTGKPPVPGRPVSLSRSNPDIPPPIDKVLTRALVQAPDSRFPDLSIMNRDLKLAASATKDAGRHVHPKESSKPAHRPERPAPAPRPVHPAITGFPEPLPMPDVDISALGRTLPMPEIPPIEAVEIPPAPEIPKIDWATLLQPLDLSHLSGLPRPKSPTHEYLQDIPDPLQAAAQAAQEAEAKLKAGN